MRESVEECLVAQRALLLDVAAAFEAAASSLETKVLAMPARATAAVTQLLVMMSGVLERHAMVCESVRAEALQTKFEHKLFVDDVEETRASENMLRASARGASCGFAPLALEPLYDVLLPAPRLRARVLLSVHPDINVRPSLEIIHTMRYALDLRVEYGRVDFSVHQVDGGPVTSLRNMRFALLLNGKRIAVNARPALRDFMAKPKSEQLRELKYEWDGFNEEDDDALDGQLVSEAFYADDATFSDTLQILRAGVVSREAAHDVFRVDFYPTLDRRVDTSNCEAQLLWPAGLQLVCMPVKDDTSLHRVVAMVPAFTDADLRAAAAALPGVVKRLPAGELRPGTYVDIECALTQPDVTDFDARAAQVQIVRAFTATRTLHCNSLQFATVLHDMWQSGKLHRFCEYEFTLETQEQDEDGEMETYSEDIHRVGLVDFLEHFSSRNRFVVQFHRSVLTNTDVLVPQLNPVQLAGPTEAFTSARTPLMLTHYLRSVLNA